MNRSLNPSTYSFFTEYAVAQVETSGDGQAFVQKGFKFALDVFKDIQETYPKLRKCHLDAHILSTAMYAAFLDFKKSETQIFVGKKENRQIRMAAAISCWINRFCPIQFEKTKHKDSKTFKNEDFTFLTLNSLLAWETAWDIKLDGDLRAKHNKISQEELMKKKSELKKDIDVYLMQGLIDCFIWRNPSFEDLIFFFEVMPPRHHI